MQRFNIRTNLNPPQADFLRDRTSPFLHMSGGFGSGKTYGLVMKLLDLSMINKHVAGGLVVPDFAEFKKDFLPEIESVCQANNIPLLHHKTDHYFKFPWSNAPLWIISAEKSIRGPNLGYIGFNEVTLLPLEKYKEGIGRVRHKAAKLPQIVSSGTPEGHISEYYEYMIEKPPEGMRIIYGSTDANKHNLNDIYIKNLLASYDTKMLEAFYKGLWVNMSESLFYYSYDPTKVHDTELDVNDWDRYHVSMDFNVDPFCATVWGFDDERVYGLTQVLLEGSNGYRTENMIAALQARGFTPNNTIIYPDPAGGARSTKGLPDTTILRNAGYEVRHRSVAPDFRKRQLNVNNLLDKGRIRINPKTCPGIIKDFVGVEQDKITLAKVKQNLKLTHFSDGLDYMCDILFPFSGTKPSVTQTNIR